MRTLEANIYPFKVISRITRKGYRTCSEGTIKTQGQRYCHRSDVFIVNFEHILNLFLVVLLMTLKR